MPSEAAHDEPTPSPFVARRSAADYSAHERTRILDEALVAHVGITVDGQPFVIPMAFGHDGERLDAATARWRAGCSAPSGTVRRLRDGHPDRRSRARAIAVPRRRWTTGRSDRRDRDPRSATSATGDGAASASSSTWFPDAPRSAARGRRCRSVVELDRRSVEGATDGVRRRAAMTSSATLGRRVPVTTSYGRRAGGRVATRRRRASTRDAPTVADAARRRHVDGAAELHGHARFAKAGPGTRYWPVVTRSIWRPPVGLVALGRAACARRRSARPSCPRSSPSRRGSSCSGRSSCSRNSCVIEAIRSSVQMPRRRPRSAA